MTTTDAEATDDEGRAGVAQDMSNDVSWAIGMFFQPIFLFYYYVTVTY
jgi:hypothetical protein